MNSVPMVKARAHFSELVKRAAQGESTQITLRGRPVALIQPAPTPAELADSGASKGPVDLDWLRRLTDAMPQQSESAGDLVRRMRDSDRY